MVVPTILARFGLELRPEPAIVGDRAFREIGLATPRPGGRGRAGFGPPQPGIDRLAIRALERLDSHPGIHQNIVDFQGTNNDSFLGKSGDYAEAENGNFEHGY